MVDRPRKIAFEPRYRDRVVDRCRKGLEEIIRSKPIRCVCPFLRVSGDWVECARDDGTCYRGHDVAKVLDMALSHFPERLDRALGLIAAQAKALGIQLPDNFGTDSLERP